MKRPTRNQQPKPLSPLDYMLQTMNDPGADLARRDRMARAAAPYCHARVADKGKKDQQAESARKAGGGDTEWAGDLVGDWPQ